MCHDLKELLERTERFERVLCCDFSICDDDKEVIYGRMDIIAILND
jgi:hypothetical protein